MELMRWCRVQWDRVLCVVALSAGTTLLVLGWVHVSGTEFIAQQVPYLASEGFGGLLLVMAGLALWITAHLSDEWATLDRLQEQRSVAAQQREELTRRMEEPEQWSSR